MNRAFIPSKLVNFLLASEEEAHFAHRGILPTRMALEYAVPSPRSLCCRDGRTLPRAFPLVSAPCHRQWWSPSPQPAFFFQGPSPCSLTLRQCLPLKELAASKTVYQTMDQ